jgi:hypothetical protein
MSGSRGEIEIRAHEASLMYSFSVKAHLIDRTGRIVI